MGLWGGVGCGTVGLWGGVGCGTVGCSGLWDCGVEFVVGLWGAVGCYYATPSQRQRNITIIVKHKSPNRHLHLWLIADPLLRDVLPWCSQLSNGE